MNIGIIIQARMGILPVFPGKILKQILRQARHFLKLFLTACIKLQTQK